jgi:hypothetical protein
MVELEMSSQDLRERSSDLCGCSFVVINSRKLSSTLKMLNDQHSSIKLTYEEEAYGSLTFLDMNIKKTGRQFGGRYLSNAHKHATMHSIKTNINRP